MTNERTRKSPLVFGFSAASPASWTKDQEQHEGGSNNADNDVDHGWVREAGSLFGWEDWRIHDRLDADPGAESLEKECLSLRKER
jgi:hypothetical protein